MTAYALGPLWPLNKIDSTSLRTIHLVSIITCIGLLLGASFGFAFAESVSLGGFEFLDPLQRGVILATPITSAITNLAGILILARNLEPILLELINSDPALDDLKELMTPSRRIIGLSLLLALPCYPALLMLDDFGREHGLAYVFETVLDSKNIAILVHVFINMQIWVVLTTTLALSVLLVYFRTLMAISRRIQIDLFRIQSYAPISTPFVYIVIGTTVILSIAMIIGFALPSEGFSREAANVSILIGFLMGIVMTLFLLPVWIMRIRIRDVKQSQLDAITHALTRDIEAQSQIIKALPGHLLSTEELMARQLFVESRWEWPIASHIQKLIIFCLLPPLTWVLAAVIENILF